MTTVTCAGNVALANFLVTSSYPNCSVRLSGMSTTTVKRKRTTLNLQQKLDILERLEKGESGSKISKEYGIGTSTVSDIRRNATSLYSYATKAKVDMAQIKSRKTARNVNLDEKTYQWYVSQRDRGVHVTDALICNKAREFNKKFGGSATFKASNGWLRHFKRRNGIFIRDYKEDHMTTEMIGLQELINQYNLNDVYIVSKTTLNWKSLPKNYSEKCSQLVTLVACSNPTGYSKLPLCLIGEGKPVLMGNKDVVEYKTSMNDWFKSVFFTQIIDKKKSSKLLLICENDFKLSHHNCKNLTIHRIVTSALGEEMKKAYRKLLLKELCADTYAGDIDKFLGELTLDKAVAMVQSGWNSLDQKAVYKVFVKLLNTPAIICNKDEDIQLMAQQCVALLPCTMDDIGKWFESDKKRFDASDNDEDDDDDSEEEEIKSDVVMLEDVKNEEEEEEEEEAEDMSEFVPSHDEAYHCFQRTIEWLGNQPEATLAQFTVLESLRDLAEKKKVAAAK